MNLSAVFIQRPIATALLAIGLAISGIVAFNFLPVAPLPQIEFPTINVQASLPGASPETMATSVATPLERQLGWIANITEMTSSSTLGSTSITIQFDLSRNIDGAARDVQAALQAARSQLPSNLPSNPTYRKVNPADPPILILSLTSEVASTGEMYDAASSILQQKISQIEGVGQVVVGGGALPAVRAELNPTALNKYGISLTDVSTAISHANSNAPKGQLTDGVRTYEIVTNDQIFKAYQYQPLVISYQNGVPVRLSDIAQVNDSIENTRAAGISDGKPAVLLILFKQPGANVIDTIDHVRALLPQLQASIPTAMKMEMVLDRSLTIRAALHDVEITLLIAMGLVIFITYLFLRDLRVMLIPGISVPLSLLGTFGIMYLLGFSLNNFSLMALVISTGFVIDDAIVVLENITRHVEEGLSPLEAAYKGSQEVCFTVLSMSMSLIAVFIPILLMGGIIGRLFREFSVTLSAAIFVSLLISLTVTPMMCTKLILLKTNEKPKKLLPKKRFSFSVYAFYQKSLSWALGHSRFMLLLILTTLALNIALFLWIPKGFFPQQDTGRITGSILGDQNLAFKPMLEKLKRYVDIIQHDPAVEHVVAYIGSNASNSGSLYITLKPLEIRKISPDEIIERLRGKLAQVKGSNLYLQAAQDLTIGGRRGNSQYQYTIWADDLDTLNDWAPRILNTITAVPGLIDVNTDQSARGLKTVVQINHDKAQRFGITTQQIDAALYNAFGQNQIATLYTAMNQYHVVMEWAPQYIQHPTALEDIYLFSESGEAVPLSTFAQFENQMTLLAVNHAGQAPAATITFNLSPGLALGDAIDRINQAMDTVHLPATLQGTFQGAAQAFQSSLASEPYLVFTALLAVYIVLGILYESLIHPITILSTLPSAGVGALLALTATRTDLSIIAMIGIILLIGIVKKNAIMMIDFALEAERNHNRSPRDAIYEAALLRFRPIMMTSVAAFLGACPLALGTAIGSELRRPLGIAIMGGLIVSQMMTLYTTPVIYLAMERCSVWWKQYRGRTV
jgi:multidrug efflux pump